MKRITYQITLSNDAYLEFVSRIETMIFPAEGNMVFKVEEVEK